jgi:hypothetical protein
MYFIALYGGWVALASLPVLGWGLKKLWPIAFPKRSV